MIPKPTPAEKRETRKAEIIEVTKQDINERFDRMARRSESLVKSVSAGNAGGIIATLTFISNNGADLVSLWVLSIFIAGTTSGLMSLNFETISKHSGIVDAINTGKERLKNVRFGRPVTRTEMPDLREALLELFQDLKDHEKPLNKFTAHGFLVTTIVSIGALFTGTLIGFLAMYASVIYEIFTT